ncbi:MFS transporter [Notoacmeibacter sp. MSK16QG-6]|uniref:MFS transporter n=1 Tax=Notoacmeibacter sp. MSK16QG-6 TaxID=2957982 RepID=UPI00209D0F64|nr:MFS transporter [Notoacmeibacter sp. MSK16QG-6]MCP1197919.1 MFS transporter [Notoacmeibacter sp. MSK16QG-6]
MLQFIRSNARWLAGGFLLSFFSSFGQTYFISLSAGEIRAEYDLTNGEWGSLYMLATLASALALPWVGRSVDIWRAGLVGAASVGGLALACMLMGFGRGIVVLGVTVWLLRLFGQGMCVHVAITAIGKWFVAQRGRALSLTAIGIDCGAAVLPLGFVFMMQSAGWRTAWFAAAAIALLIIMPIVGALLHVDRLPQASDPISTRPTVRDWTRGEALRDPLFYILLAGVLIPPFVGTTIAFHQVYLTELRGWSLATFASGYPVFSIATVASALLCGSLIDRFTALRILPIFLLPLIVGTVIIATGRGEWAIFVWMACFGMAQGTSSTLLGAVWPEVYGTAHLGAIRSVIIAATVFSTAAGPGLTGMLIDAGFDYSMQILFMAAMAALMMFALVPLSLRLRRRLEDEALSMA